MEGNDYLYVTVLSESKKTQWFPQEKLIRYAAK
jgi:hypothetical protein